MKKKLTNSIFKFFIFYFTWLTLFELSPSLKISVKAENNHQNFLLKKKLIFKSEKLKDIEKNFIFQEDIEIFEESLKNNLINLDNRFLNILVLNNKDKSQDFDVNIESDIQYQENNTFFAEGNAVIYFSDASLRADKVAYDSELNQITAIGNIIFLKGKQTFEASNLFYDFKNNEGYIDNIYGVLNVKSINSDFEVLDINEEKEILKDSSLKIESLKKVNSLSIGLVNDFEETRKFNPTNINLNIPSINVWRYKSDKIFFEDNTLKSNKIIFTNDALNEPQFFLESKNFTAEVINDKIKLISRKSWIILDDKIKLPIGRRTIFDRDPITRWGIGYDVTEKDGFYITRSLNEVKISESFLLNLQPNFLIQRAIKGNSKAFRASNSSIFSAKTRNDIDVSDMFAIDADLTGTFNDWKMGINTSFNSLNPDRISEAARAKLTLKRTFDLNDKNEEKIEDINLDTENKEKFSNLLDLKLYSSYREKVLRGYLGDQEIYFGNGLIFENKKSWSMDNKKTSLITLYDVGEFKAKSRNAEVHKTLFRNVFAAKFVNKFSLWEREGLDINIDNNYKYSPEVINQGLDWQTKIQSAIYLYSDDSSQKIISLSTGPVLTLGELKNNFFDYTYLKINSSYTKKGGESPFAFDNIDKSFRINFNLDQQIYGALVFSYDNSYNFDNGEFKKGNYGLDFKRRAYSLGAFYNATNKSLGIRFNIFNFDYSGLSPKF